MTGFHDGRMRLPKILRRWLPWAALVLAAVRLPAEVFDFASPTI